MQVTIDLAMSSGIIKFLNIQHGSEMSDYKRWRVVKDLRLVVFKTFLLKSPGFLKSFVYGVYDDTCHTYHTKNMTVNKMVTSSRRNMSTASCGTPELNMEAVWRTAGKLALCSQTTSSVLQRKIAEINILV